MINRGASAVGSLLRSTVRAGFRMAGMGEAGHTTLDEQTISSNIRHLALDITWFGVLSGTAINFLQVYVVRLGASSLLVSALTFGPALVNAFWQLPAARLMGRSGHRMRWVLGAGLAWRLSFLGIALVPFLTAQWRPELTVAVVVAGAVAQAAAVVSFLSMLADAVPQDRIPQLMSLRMAGLGLTSTLAALLAGQLLKSLAFPGNYQLLFAIGVMASLVSQWHVSQARVPDRATPRPSGRAGLGEFERSLRDGRFTRFAVAVAVLQIALGMIAPLMPLLWIRGLDASDQQISLLVTTYSGLSVLGSLGMRRVVRRLGRERVLAGGAAAFALYPLLASLMPTVWWLLPWTALGGLFISAVNVTLFDNLVAMTPAGDRTSYMAVYNTFANLALFLGPLLASALVAGAGGPQPGLRVAAAISLLAGLLLFRSLRPAGAA